ncbi:MAG TPA: O-antigen ligase family protein [Hymenobacter sp.]|jgi:O-antigen ligase|uniref:O-antigen ligase family protein n=1 Tax=Hymenobacter sp. TaxID=1898978 RepID=UPI002EDB41F2
MTPSRFRAFLLLLFYGSLFSLPLSVDWFSDRGFGLTLLTEPLMALTVGVLVLGGVGGWLRWPGKAHRLDKLIGIHFGTLFLATVFSGAPLVSAKYLATLLLYVAFGYGVPRVLHLTRVEWLRALGVLATSTALLAGYVLVRHLMQGISYSNSYIIAQPFLQHGHTNLTVMLEPLVLLLNLALLHHPLLRKQGLRLLATALLTVVLMVVAFSYSRASYISLVMQALLLLFYVGWREWRQLLLPWSVAACLILTTWQLLTQTHPDAVKVTDKSIVHELGTVSDFTPTNESNAERKNRWVFGLELFEQEPIIGVGPGTFPDRYLDFVRNAPSHVNYTITFRRMNSHNLYVTWLVEAGALGLATGVMLLGYVGLRLLRWTWRRRLTPTQVGFTVYFLFFLLHSLTQDFWQEPRVIVLFWLAMGLQRYYERPTPVALRQTAATA